MWSSERVWLCHPKLDRCRYGSKRKLPDEKTELQKKESRPAKARDPEETGVYGRRRKRDFSKNQEENFPEPYRDSEPGRARVVGQTRRRKARHRRMPPKCGSVEAQTQLE